MNSEPEQQLSDFTPGIFTEYAGVRIYRVYSKWDDGPWTLKRFHFATDRMEAGDSFDIRLLPIRDEEKVKVEKDPPDEDVEKRVIHRAIEIGWITPENTPAAQWADISDEFKGFMKKLLGKSIGVESLSVESILGSPERSEADVMFVIEIFSALLARAAQRFFTEWEGGNVLREGIREMVLGKRSEPAAAGSSA